MTNEITIGLFLLSGFLFGAGWAWRHESKAWNKGRCSKCNCFWRSFDMDSSGARGYKCTGCKPTRRIWISWPVDRGEYDES